jgi:hypothetical protein
MEALYITLTALGIAGLIVLLLVIWFCWPVKLPHEVIVTSEPPPTSPPPSIFSSRIGKNKALHHLI